jgi:hypothetical protein
MDKPTIQFVLQSMLDKLNLIWIAERSWADGLFTSKIRFYDYQDAPRLGKQISFKIYTDQLGMLGPFDAFSGRDRDPDISLEWILTDIYYRLVNYKLMFLVDEI